MVMKEFRLESSRILVSTDLLARIIDLPDRSRSSSIKNLDDSKLHSSNRSGRRIRSGRRSCD
jgi:superfamily II DNA/RNA helicase